jgi:hypothetical protein
VDHAARGVMAPLSAVGLELLPHGSPLPKGEVERVRGRIYSSKITTAHAA